MAKPPVAFNRTFTYHPSLVPFASSKQDYLKSHPDASFGYIATSTLVISANSNTTNDTSNQHLTPPSPHVLLLQRAASDSDPNKWEPPGGACDDSDETILHGAARELCEEAGLQVGIFVGLVPGDGGAHFFTLDDGKEVCQFNFLAKVANDGGDESKGVKVKLEPREHQRFVWATGDDVRARMVDGVKLEFTREEVWRTVLLGFEYIGGSVDGQQE